MSGYVNDPIKKALSTGPEPMKPATVRYFVGKSRAEATRLLQRAAEVERNADKALTTSERSAARLVAADLRKQATRMEGDPVAAFELQRARSYRATANGIGTGPLAAFYRQCASDLERKYR